jgi:diguanylate cyclase (GGDEF)-like protein/PAS domain S-box-containing protein
MDAGRKVAGLALSAAIATAAALIFLLAPAGSRRTTEEALPEYGEAAAEIRVELGPEERAYLQEHGPVRFSVDPDWEPYERIAEGRYVGIAADLFTLIAGRLGLDVRLVPTVAWPESIQAVKEGKTDLLVFLNRTPEREKWLDFTEPYFTDPNVFITRSEHGFIFDPARLAGSSIVFPEGTSLEEKVRARYPNLRVLLAKSEAEALSMVEDRSADMTLRSLTVAAYTIRKSGLFNLKVAGQLPDETNRFCIGVSKESAPLRDILNKGVRTVTPQDVERIVNRHISISVQTAVDYVPLLRVLGAFLLVAAVGAFFMHRQRLHARHLRTVIDAVPGYIYAKDAEGRFLLANKSAASLFGLAPEQVVGKTDLDYGADPEKAAADREADRRVIETGVPLAIPERQDLRQDRTPGWFQTIKIPYRHPDLKAPAVLGVSIDITDRILAERKLADSERQFRFIAEHATDVIWTYDTEEKRFTFISPSIRNLRGIAPEEALRQTMDDAVSPGSREAVAAAIREAVERFRAGEAGRNWTLDVEQPRADGTTIWTEVTCKLATDSVTGRLILYGSSRDVSERKRLEREERERNLQLQMARESERRGRLDAVRALGFSRTLLEAVPAAVFYKDRQGRFIGCNALFTEILGFTEDQIRGKTVYDLWPREDCLLQDQSDLDLMEHPEYQRFETTVVDRRGRIRDVIFSKDVYRDETGQVAGMIASFLDITEQQELRKELERQATTDALTGARNRRFFYEEAEREFARSRRYRQPLSVMMLDIDHFKRVNDTFGHHAGDEVLRRTAEVFRGEIRDGDLFGRLGGEEFAVLMPQTDLAGARMLAERLRATYAELRIRGEWEGEIAPTVSVGVAETLATDADIEQTIRRADAGLYAAKRAGRNRVGVVDGAGES